MRGGAQAHLLEANDGKFYVVKFSNNPQHRRVLLNEWIGSVILRHLKIDTPETNLIEITSEFLRDNPRVFMETGTRRLPAIGLHFGSRFPGDPAHDPVFDFVPDSLLIGACMNIDHYIGALVFDKWTSNVDPRQSIFYKHGMLRPRCIRFIAQMIDNGAIFGGPDWRFDDLPTQGHYWRSAVYSKVQSLGDFEPWLQRVKDLPLAVVYDCLKQVPGEWIDGEASALERLLEQLFKRRSRIGNLIETARIAKPTLFPNWQA